MKKIKMKMFLSSIQVCKQRQPECDLVVYNCYETIGGFAIQCSSSGWTRLQMEEKGRDSKR